MAGTLLDRLRNTASNAAGANPLVAAPGATPSGSSVLTGMLAARRGRIDAPGGIQAESLDETRAVGDAAEKQSGLARQVDLGAAAARGQEAGLEQSIRQSSAALGLQKQAQEQKGEQARAQLGEQSRQAGLGLTLEQSAADAERAGAEARLRNDKYVTRLEQEGNIRRLQDAVRFKEELYRGTMGDSMLILQKKLGHNELMSADNNQFMQDLAKLDMEDYLAIASIQAKSAAAAEVATGVGEVVKGGTEMYAAGGTRNRQAFQDKKDGYNPDVDYTE